MGGCDLAVYTGLPSQQSKHAACIQIRTGRLKKMKVCKCKWHIIILVVT